MDTDPVSDADYAACLADLGKVNRLTGAYQPTLRFLSRALRRLPPGQTELRVLDVGSGGGDTLRRVWRWGKRRGMSLKLEGLDLSPQGTRAAKAATPAWMTIQWRTGDMFALDPAERWDIICSSLVAHHLDDAALVRMLRWMEAASVGWFVNDLHRHPIAYHGFRALSALAGWHRFVRHDGAVSVTRAFRRAEWQALLTEAGVPGEVRWHPLFRLCVGRLR